VITFVGVGPKPDTFPRQPANNNHSSSGRITALVLGADSTRMYAGSFAGVWRSDNSGQSWFQLTWPEPPAGTAQAEVQGALYPPHIFDLAASPADPDVVVACALDSQFADGRDGLYRSEDGGATWTLVLKSFSTTNPTSLNVAFAPDDPQLVYAVGTLVSRFGQTLGVLAISQDAGKTWTTRFVGSSLWHVAVAPVEVDGTRRVYAAGDSAIWYSSDAGHTWTADGGVATIKAARQALSDFQQTCDPPGGVGGFGGQVAYAGGNAPRILAVEPGTPSRVYLATTGGANGPTYYSETVPDGTLVNTDCKRLAGEASLWSGDFRQFRATGSAQWSLLAGPPVYSGVSSPSGNCYVATKATAEGFLLFFSDNSHVHVSAGAPASNASWHRLDGMDASQTKRAGVNYNSLFVHVDPHAIAFTPDFDITLKAPSGVQAPYDQNSELDQHLAGTVWMANDGGVYRCDDGGVDENSWQMTSGLETIDPVNIAGLYGIGDTPALYFGCGDNNDFFSRDGGAHWGDPGSGCGDCDAWFTDTAHANWVLQFLPRRSDGQICIIKSDGSAYPDASDSDSKTYVPSPKRLNAGKLIPYAQSDVYLIGYRPLIKALATEAPLSDGDVVIIEQTLAGTATLFRTTAISSIATPDDWHDTSKAQQIGPTLPPGAIVVQPSGGHQSPAFYVSDRGGSVWKLSADQAQWNMIVPSSAVGSQPVGGALQWFVDPYDPDGIYVLDSQGVKLSIDGGQGWILDTALTHAVTAGGKLTISSALLKNMEFSRGERQTRFAMGTAGVFCTMDFGVSWLPVLNAIARPGRPESGFFDPFSDQTDRAIYVEGEGRSVLRVGGLPELPPFQTSHPLDLMEFAALDY
jgi:hypothetical protein